MEIKNNQKDNLTITHPHIAKQWHPTKNGNLKSIDVTYGSPKKVWWICEKGHEWESTIANRRKCGCPYCSNQKILVGFNDLATTYPEVAKQWHPTKNGDLKPTDVIAGSSKKAWWICEKGHEWEATIASRRKHGCPYCSNQKALVGFNDLATTHPELVKEWHPTKNGDLKPTDIVAGSNKKVWWMCKFGHEWEAVSFTRTKQSGCPFCSAKGMSLKEQIVFYYIKKYLDTEVLYRKRIGKYEADIFMPELNIVIEYDGYFWHKNREKEDKRKNLFFAQLGYKIYRIREIPLKKLNDISIDFLYEYRSDDEFEKIIEIIIKEISNKTVKIDILNDMSNLSIFTKKIAEEDSLFKKYPEIASEWHPTKNGKLKPTDITAGSNKKVWWQCEKGHEWAAVVSDRAQGLGCPYCSNKKVLTGYNDLATTHPELAKQWHPTKNGELKPTDVIAGSNKKVWWQCEKGHEYQQSVSSKKVGLGCPICSNKKVLAGYNDLATTHPELAKQWHPTKNSNLKPTDVTYGHAKSVWWICEHNHAWKSTICTRITGAGCPVCSNRNVLKGENDLETLYPNIAKQWHPTKNGDLKPSDVVPGSGKKVWWKCEVDGHEWMAAIVHRTQGGGCPVCVNKETIAGYNDFATTHPELAKQWHPTKNGDFKPTDVTAGSIKTVWWICDKGHEWKATISSRRRCGCPICSNKKILVGYNDLATTHPEIAKWWHPTKNEGLKPTDVTYGSSKKAWWICEKGHEYQKRIKKVVRGEHCPYCNQITKNQNRLSALKTKKENTNSMFSQQNTTQKTSK